MRSAAQQPAQWWTPRKETGSKWHAVLSVSCSSKKKTETKKKSDCYEKKRLSLALNDSRAGGLSSAMPRCVAIWVRT